MEIERKFLVNTLPANLEQYPSHQIEQGYLCTNPVVRIRKEDDTYYLTYKGSGKMAREEHNLALTAQSYEHLLPKVDGLIIRKRRYCIPCPPYTIELDIFDGHLNGLIMAEVEFPTVKEAMNYVPPAWMSEDVTNDHRYHNSYLSQNNKPD